MTMSDSSGRLDLTGNVDLERIIIDLIRVGRSSSDPNDIYDSVTIRVSSESALDALKKAAKKAKKLVDSDTESEYDKELFYR